MILSHDIMSDNKDSNYGNEYKAIDYNKEIKRGIVP